MFCKVPDGGNLGILAPPLGDTPGVCQASPTGLPGIGRAASCEAAAAVDSSSVAASGAVVAGSCQYSIVFRARL